MFYAEFSPSPALRPAVRCLWMLRHGAAPAPATEADRVVPDGCAEIVLNCADPFRRVHTGGGSHRQEEVLLVGQIRRAIMIQATGEVDLLGIRFEPGGLHELLGVPMHELADLDLRLGDVAPRLHEDLGGVRGLPARARRGAVEAALCRQLGRRTRRGAGELGLVACAASRIERGLTATDSLARSLGITRRSLERTFRREVGLSPKLYARIRRLQGVLRRLDDAPAGVSWVHLAAAHDYADQSHLIRDFRLLAGTTPQRYLAENTPLAGLFSTGAESHSSNPPGAGAATLPAE